MKKVFTTILATCMVGSLLVACGNNNENTASESESNQKVVAWAWDPAFNGKALEIAEELYAAQNPGFELDIVEMSKTDLEQKLNTNLAAGVKDGLPDVILVNDSNVEKYVLSYPDTFATFTNAMDFSNFSEYKVDNLTVENEVYGVPFDIGVTGLFYRTDILEQAGFTGADLENITWDRYIEIGKEVKEKTGAYFATVNPNDEAWTSILLQSAGSWYITPENEGNFVNNPAMVKTMEYYKAIADSGFAKIVTGWSEFVGSINAGEVATVVSGVWQISSIMESQDQAGKWGVAPTPRLDLEGSANASNEGGSNWFVLENSANKELAIDFLASTFGGSSELYDRFLTEAGGVGSYIPAFSSEAYQQPAEFFGGQKVYSDFTEWSTQVPGITLGTYTQEAKDALKNELPNILNGADIEQSLANIQKLYEQQVQ